MDEVSIRLSYAAGCRVLGENKVQEAYRKWGNLSDLPHLRWSVIGRLQTNKAKLVARFACELQTLDSLRLAEALDRRLQVEGRQLDVYVLVNASGEASKYGLPPEDVMPFLKALSFFPSLRVKGLMTLALLSGDFEIAIEEGATIVRVGHSAPEPFPAAITGLLASLEKTDSFRCNVRM